MNSPREIKLITHEPGELVEVEARSAVVRPTRSEIAEVVAQVLYSDAVVDRTGLIADALLAHFAFGVAVSDSQETPTL